MKRLSGSDAGFTLIELMIVVAIIGILVAVAIPNFMRAMDKARYNSCLQSLTGLKVAEEMYITDNNQYVIANADLEKLGMYMIPGCTALDGCAPPNDVASKLNNNCKNGGYTVGGTAFDYQIHGTAKDRSNAGAGCKICVTSRGFIPEKYIPGDCALGTCP
jgi:prepilin-type N-terminal cleavage/methylation domain-containing protein